MHTNHGFNEGKFISERMIYSARIGVNINRCNELFVKLNRRLPEKQEVRRCDRNWSIDTEDGNLELVAGLHRIGEYDAIRNVEALDRGRAGEAGPARHLAIDPDFRIIVDIRCEHRLGARSFEIPDFCRYGQIGAEPEKRYFAASAPVRQPLGFDGRP